MTESGTRLLTSPDRSIEARGAGWINKAPSPADQRVRLGSPERRLMEAMLLLCGERGYIEVSVQAVVSRSGVSRNTFYKHFVDKEDCFFRAYDAGVEELARQVLEPAEAAADWRAGVRAGLAALVRVVDEQPVIARCLLIEAYPAGRKAMDKRAEMMRRFGWALDRVRSTMRNGAPPPPLTSEVVVGGLESLVRMQVQAGDPPTATELLPDLVYFAVSPYLGGEVATADAQLARSEARKGASEASD